jgi:hypothetical protein
MPLVKSRGQRHIPERVAVLPASVAAGLRFPSMPGAAPAVASEATLDEPAARPGDSA